MRVTNKMISDQVMRNLDRVLNRFMRLQARMSTGKRIQTPSDDPIGTQKDLKYRQILSQVDRFRVNIGKAHNLLGTYDNVVGEMIGNMEQAMQSLLSVRGNVGDRINCLETTDRRLMDLNYNFTDLLSEVEDADLTKLVADLAREENTYQAALIASSKIIQPTLLVFLR